MGNSSPPCFASKPCGVCIVAGCSFCNGEEWEHRVLTELNGKLAHCSRPFLAASPAHAGILDCEIKQFQRRIIGWEAAAGLDDLAQRAMQRLDSIRGVYHLANAGREREERHDVLPGPAPGLADRRIALAPFGLELLEPDERHVGVLGPIDRLDAGQDQLAVLP